MTIQYKHTELSVDISKLIYTELTDIYIYIVDMTSVIDSHISLSNILAYRTTILAVEFTDPSGQPSLDPAWIAPGRQVLTKQERRQLRKLRWQVGFLRSLPWGYQWIGFVGKIYRKP